LWMQYSKKHTFVKAINESQLFLENGMAVLYIRIMCFSSRRHNGNETIR